MIILVTIGFEYLITFPFRVEGHVVFFNYSFKYGIKRKTHSFAWILGRVFGCLSNAKSRLQRWNKNKTTHKAW